ncbi:MAG TPA: aminotransferase class I/II-fold pyridoxal phosphate-dependent enzyme [Chitinophagales bacterium]|nr:aminotransferase class I/II-fold pyridoxal phosphate-dependent enzyme [Chitinophagales bacterium]
MKTQKNKPGKATGFDSIAAHDKFRHEIRIEPHTVPIYSSSTFIYESPEAAQKIFSRKAEGFAYSRFTHPNAVLAEEKLEQMETFGLGIAAKALLFTSGMTALSNLFLSLLKPGDCIVTHGNIYGTSVDYFNHFGETYGIKIIYTDFKNPAGIEQQLKANKNVKLLYAETPSNPTIGCYDLNLLGKLAAKYKVKFAVDSTFASPYLQQPFKHGADFVMHSATKYLNGHGTALGGVLIGRDVEFMNGRVWKTRKITGGICSPFDAWMLNNGMKTLSLRMDKHCANSLAVAKFLQAHPGVKSVNYLGLKGHADHALAKKQMRNFGGVLSFDLKNGYKAGEKLMKKIKFCRLTASLGTIDTLLQHPASMSHSFVAKAQREAYGITDGLVRISVGIEDVNDIIADLEQALKP